MLRQQLQRFRGMLITRSDDGYFGRNPETRLVESSFNLEEVRCTGTVNETQDKARDFFRQVKHGGMVGLENSIPPCHQDRAAAL